MAGDSDKGPGGVRFAIAGSVGWAAWLMFDDSAPVEALIGLSPAVLHPIILRLAQGRPTGFLQQAVAWLQVPAALALLLGLSRAPGPLAGWLCVPWLLVTVATALVGLRRAFDHGLRPLGELTIDAGLMMVAVGGAWATAAGFGLRPMGFSATIVLLTAAHFHYAGFVLPVLAGLAARRVSLPVYRVVLVGVLVGVPLTAVGITFSPTIEVIAAVIVASSAAGLGAAQIAIARKESRGVATLLLAVSSLALFHGMAFATVYAIGEYRGMPWPAIPDMVTLHGTVNALGFGLLGTWGWMLLEGHRSVGDDDA